MNGWVDFFFFFFLGGEGRGVFKEDENTCDEILCYIIMKNVGTKILLHSYLQFITAKVNGGGGGRKDCATSCTRR